MKKQLVGTGVVALSSLFLVACGQQTAKSGNHTIYDVKTTKVTTKDDEWIIRGTTDAPDGTKIVAVPSNSVGDDLNGSEKPGYDLGFPKVKDGKFKMKLSALDASDSTSYKTGKKDKVAIFAVTNYTKKYDDEVSSKLIDAFNDKFDPTTLKITSSQSKYMKSLDDNNESDDTTSDSSNDATTSSSSSESSSSSVDTTSYQAVTYDQIARNPDDYQDSEVKLSGQVMQVQNAHNGSVVLLWLNDDPDQLVMVGINKDYMPDNGNILEDDEITVYGTGDGTQKYDTTSGAKNEVPFVRADATTTDSGKSNSAY